ncbi:hypothetical protein [Halostagnicola sp. A-GB9-2]|uniref:hypothetical protein n=1 Tax=Halostagnicola sp. A-GB9-2 TaxID=3048066 RepID=UPI0024C01B93|nr:hypothetical protein [Halostagnicola sp. A-GB9-2]MDJ1434206.1 hypothetical protein [Halostagnicola sp. A-GB9-2]
MNESSPLSPEHVTLVDTNVFISTGNPGKPKYRRFRRVVRRAGVTLLVPARVEEEIEQGGVTPALNQAREEGWAKIVDAPIVSQGRATTAQDIMRRAIASKSAEKDEHDVEKADPVFAGLAIEYLLDKKRPDNVTIITADRIAQKSIEIAVSSLGYDDQVSIISLWDIIDFEDNDFTII